MRRPWGDEVIRLVVNGREISAAEVQLLAAAMVDDAIGRLIKELRADIGRHVQRVINRLKGRVD
jgi:hypothetical protein